jgi:hypothetical protein
MMRKRGLWVLASVVLLSGCPTIGTLTRARPIGPGRNEITVGLSAHGFVPEVLGESGSSSDVALVTIPTMDLMYRHGIGRAFDFGISLTGWGKIGADLKFSLINTPAFVLSVNPGAGGFFAKIGDVGGGYVQFDLPVMIDLQLGPAVALTVAAKYIGIYGFAAEDETNSSASAYTSLIGGTMGIEFRVARWFRIMPHGGVAYFFNDVTENSNVTAVFFTGGVAFKFLFGGAPPPPPARAPGPRPAGY